jgi:hypothetical protein
MMFGGTETGSFGRFVLAVAMALAGMPAAAHAQFFNPPAVQRPPADVPSVPSVPAPAQSIAPPSGNVAPPSTPRAMQLQSLPPSGNLSPAQSAPAVVPAGQVPLSVSARFGRELPAISGGLHWRIYRPEQNGVPRLVKEDRGAAPMIPLPPGNYVVNVAFGLATVTKPVQVRSGDPVKEVFEIPAGGLRIEGKVGDVRIPPGQISFELYKGSQFEPGDKRAIAHSVMTGDVVLVPEGTYHIVSNYGDGNSVVRSDIRVQVGKLTDVTVNHRAAIITLKLVNERGGEARANTQWSVLTPGGDVIKESVVGAFPRVILAEGEYRTIARNDGKTYEGEFRVVNGVDREVEIVAR